jgi:hypothetical protein
VWGEEGDPAHQAGKKMGSWHHTVEEIRHPQDVRRHGDWARHDTTKAPLCTEYVSLCVLCASICCTLDDCSREPYLTVSICFRRINHMAVKKPFAFILWCTRSCVRHSTHTLKPWKLTLGLWRNIFLCPTRRSGRVMLSVCK